MTFDKGYEWIIKREKWIEYGYRTERETPRK